MIVSIHQPEHLPWMGLIHKIAQSDLYVVLDVVQFKKNYFENRNRIYTPQGLQWLTVPVRLKGHMEKEFREIEVVPGWKRKYLKTLEMTYTPAPHGEDLEPILEVIRQWEGSRISELNLALISTLLERLGVETRVMRASELEGLHGTQTELLISILQAVGASAYIVGKSGFEYMELPLFEGTGIELCPHRFDHPRYTPFNFPVFQDFPSIVDVMANLGRERTSEMVHAGRL